MSHSPRNVHLTSVVRRLPIGADVQPHEPSVQPHEPSVQPRGGVHFRLWAPRCQSVMVEVNSAAGKILEPARMIAEDDGYYSALVPEAAAGDRYWFLLDGSSDRLPDPASRFQPEGPHGPSQIVDPSTFEWHDGNWPGVKLRGQVMYELHIGTFTPEGTWTSAAAQLPELAAAGISLLEVMPVSAFPGRFNWGYDGVDLYAPTQLYGTPDDMRHFVDQAHQHGIGVILDVVYNHIGPDGNYLKRFSEDYFTHLHETDWGEAINFYGPNSGRVREFFIHNAAYWIEEFHLDGLRLDATQNIYDESPDHIIAVLTRHARSAAGQRSIVVIAENETQEARLVRPPEKGGLGLDGVWNDDFHHAAVVALRERNEAYYSDYQGTASELLAAVKYGYLYQGQWSQWQKKRRGTPARDLPPWSFITFLENHDQVSNSLDGRRMHQLTHPGRYRAMTALLLLGPGTPLLFQGQEFGASPPFLFFADHHPELARLVHKGRREFLMQFPSLADEASQAAIPNPSDETTFRRSCLDLSEREQHEPIYRLHKDLLRLRRSEPVLEPRDERWYDGAVLGGGKLLALRYFAKDDRDDRLLVVNLGGDAPLSPRAEPLLAPATGMRWTIRWSSEDLIYGGLGTPDLVNAGDWRPLGEAALWLAMEPEGNSE